MTSNAWVPYSIIILSRKLENLRVIDLANKFISSEWMDQIIIHFLEKHFPRIKKNTVRE